MTLAIKRRTAMRLNIPDAFRVSQGAIDKALHREPQPEPAPQPSFNESKLLTLRDQAAERHAEYLSVDKRRSQALDQVRDLERQLRQLGHWPASTAAAAEHQAAQRDRLVGDLERAEAEFRRLDQRWNEASARSKQARAIARHLTEYAKKNLGWREPGQPEDYTITG